MEEVERLRNLKFKNSSRKLQNAEDAAEEPLDRINEYNTRIYNDEKLWMQWRSHNNRPLLFFTKCLKTMKKPQKQLLS